MKWKQVLAVALCATCAVPVEARVKRRAKAGARVKRAVKAAKVTPAMLRGKIVFARGNGLWNVDSNSGQKRQVLSIPEDATFFTIWQLSTDARYVLYSQQFLDKKQKELSTGSELFRLNVGKRKPIRLTHQDFSGYITNARLSPDGRRIAYTYSSGRRQGGPGDESREVRVVNADGTTDERFAGDVGDPRQAFYKAFWSRDGKRLLFTCYVGTIGTDSPGAPELQTALADGSDVQAFDGQWWNFVMPQVSPDGKQRIIIKGATPEWYAPHQLFVENQSGEAKQVTHLLSDSLAQGTRFDTTQAVQTAKWLSNTRLLFQMSESYRTIASIGPDGKPAPEPPGPRIKLCIINADGSGLKVLVENAALVDAFDPQSLY